MRRVVWITKQLWLKPGPMTYMGLLNARAFAENFVSSDLFICADARHDAGKTEQELAEFYGLPAHELFTVHCVNETNRHSRNAYKAAIAAIAAIEATMPQVTKYWRQPLIMWRSAFCLG